MKTVWNQAKDDRGQETREFRITREGARDITGALWLPENADADTLVCFGHGASGDRYQTPISYLAERFTIEASLPVLSIDGPVHGLRQVAEGGRNAFFPEYQREDSIRDMTDDWSVAIEAVREQCAAPRLAYFGLSMGSIYGIPLVASRQDIVAATLGLVGVSPDFPHGDEILAAAEKINCPVFFLMQLEDELFSREGYLKVFDAFASEDKRIHANPGLHPEIPGEEIDFAFEFLLDHIYGRRQRRIVNPLAE